MIGGCGSVCLGRAIQMRVQCAHNDIPVLVSDGWNRSNLWASWSQAAQMEKMNSPCT